MPSEVLNEAEIQKRSQTKIFSTILNHNGTITSFGDGFVDAVWGVPIATSNDARKVIQCAEDLREYVAVVKEDNETGNEESVKELQLACGIAKTTTRTHSTQTHLTHAYAITDDAQNIANLLAVAGLNYNVGIIVDEKSYRSLDAKGNSVAKQQYVFRKLDSGIYRASPEAAVKAMEAIKTHESRMRRQSSTLKRALAKAEDTSAAASIIDITEEIRSRERNEILQNSIALYQIVSSAENAFDIEICRALPQYIEGIARYESQDWEQATVQLEKFLSLVDGDLPARMLLERVEALREKSFSFTKRGLAIGG